MTPRLKDAVCQVSFKPKVANLPQLAWKSCILGTCSIRMGGYPVLASVGSMQGPQGMGLLQWAH